MNGRGEFERPEFGRGGRGAGVLIGVDRRRGVIRVYRRVYSRFDLVCDRRVEERAGGVGKIDGGEGRVDERFKFVVSRRGVRRFRGRFDVDGGRF